MSAPKLLGMSVCDLLVLLSSARMEPVLPVRLPVEVRLWPVANRA